MKKAVLAIILAMVLLMTACGNETSNTTETTQETTTKKAEDDYYILIDGVKHEINYFNTLNDLQISDLQTKTITVRAELQEVCGGTYYRSLAYDIDSYLRIGGFMGWYCFWVETSGHEDTVKNWEPGDIIEATGVIYAFEQINIFLKWADFYGDGTIKVKNVTRNESFTAVYTGD